MLKKKKTGIRMSIPLLRFDGGGVVGVYACRRVTGIFGDCKFEIGCGSDSKSHPQSFS